MVLCGAATCPAALKRFWSICALSAQDVDAAFVGRTADAAKGLTFSGALVVGTRTVDLGRLGSTGTVA